MTSIEMVVHHITSPILPNRRQSAFKLIRLLLFFIGLISHCASVTFCNLDCVHPNCRISLDIITDPYGLNDLCNINANRVALTVIFKVIFKGLFSPITPFLLHQSLQMCSYTCRPIRSNCKI